MRLSNETIRLRALEPEDLDALYEWENNEKLWHLSNTQTPFSKYILKQYLKTSHLDIYQVKQVRLVIDLINENRSIGLIDLFEFEPFHKRAGIGILIHKDCDKSKGYASKSLDILIDYCKETLGLHQLFCNIISDNTRSIELFKSKGFELCGVKKDWILQNNHWKDEAMYQLILN